MDKILNALCVIFEILDLMSGIIVWTVIAIIVTLIFIGIVVAGFGYSQVAGIIILIIVLSFAWCLIRGN